MSEIKKIIITGASGFLGSHLTERLKDAGGYCIYALSSQPEKLKGRIGGANIEYLNKECFENNAEQMKGAIVVNCAFPRNSTGTGFADGLRYIQRVFESAVYGGAEAVLNISSQSVYSQLRTEAATEDTPICLESPYAVGKYAVELMLESICRGSDTAYTNLRMASLIGPGFDQRIVNRFALKIINHEPVTVVRQDKKLGFLDVEDAVSAILAVSACPVSCWKDVYNVGNGKAYTVETIYHVVAAVLKERTDVEEPTVENGSEISSTAVSFQRLQADTGFIPRIDLENSVRRITAHI